MSGYRVITCSALEDAKAFLSDGNWCQVDRVVNKNGVMKLCMTQAVWDSCMRETKDDGVSGYHIYGLACDAIREAIKQVSVLPVLQQPKKLTTDDIDDWANDPARTLSNIVSVIECAAKIAMTDKLPYQDYLAYYYAIEVESPA